MQPISVELVAAALNAGFTTLWTPMPALACETPAIALQAAQPAAEAAAALTHALRCDPTPDPVAVLPMLTRILDAAAGVLRLVAQQIEHLGQTGTHPADSWPPA